MKSPVPQGDDDIGSPCRGSAGAVDRGDATKVSPLWNRRLLHALVIGLGWFLFVWSWHRVTVDRPEVGELRVLMIAAVVVVPLLTLSWVAHNVGIYRRKGPRKAGRAVPLRYEQDFNGRTIDADFAGLACSRRIDVVVDGGVKHFIGIEAIEASTSVPRMERV